MRGDPLLEFIDIHVLQQWFIATREIIIDVIYSTPAWKESPVLGGLTRQVACYTL
jgi:hypothetical protein